MQAELIAIGTELTLGSTVDTNSSWIAQQLHTLGIPVQRITLIKDRQQDLVQVIREAWERSELVICTGGLGPTADDLTREAIAEALDRPLQFHQDLLDHIAARFKSFGRTMSESNRQQAYVPQTAKPIANARGTAPIFVIHEDQHLLWVFPGVPSEMKFLVETELIPYLRDECGIKTITKLRSVYLSGTSEAEAGEAIADLMLAEYPTVGISAKAAQYEIRISAQGADPAKIDADIEQVVQTIHERLGRYILEHGVLEQEVATLLKQHSATLALYEGILFAPIYTAFSQIPGGLDAIRGIQIHPLDKPVDSDGADTLARSAATTVREEWRTTYGLAIQPAIEQADGWTPMCIALSGVDGERSSCRRIDLRARGTKGFIATAALELLRQALKEHDHHV